MIDPSSTSSQTRNSLALVSFLVRDYDEAIAFFVTAMGFRLIEDTRLSDEKRWVVVAPEGPSGTSLLLAKAANAEQLLHIGNQAGGRVFLFLETTDFRNQHQHMLSSGVTFVESPREEPYGTVAVFKDLYGNKWDLIQRHVLESNAPQVR